MLAPLVRFAVGFACCAAVAWVLFRLIGAAGIVFSAPLFGLALARPLIEIAGGGVRAARALALHDIEGRHYEFKGTSIDIVEDDTGHRWLRLDNVRSVLRGLPGDRVLERVLGAGFLRGDLSTAPRIQAEALLGVLRKASDPRSLRFLHWLDSASNSKTDRAAQGSGRISAGTRRNRPHQCRAILAAPFACHRQARNGKINPSL